MMVNFYERTYILEGKHREMIINKERWNMKYNEHK